MKNKNYNLLYENRELSWLKFNERVLEEAADPSVPLCEKLSFIRIFQDNLDEFYMVRVGFLYDQMLYTEHYKDTKTGMSVKEQLKAIYQRTAELLQQKDRLYKRVMASLLSSGMQMIQFTDIDYSDAVYLEQYFKQYVLPLLSAQVVSKKNPFPFLKHKSIYAVALLESKNKHQIGIVPCSCQVFKRLIILPSNPGKYMLIEDLTLHYMHLIFPKYTVKSKSLIQITRSADIDVDEAFADEERDCRDCMQEMIAQRKRLRAVKMECSMLLDEKVIQHLCKHLSLNKEQIFYSKAPLNLSYIDMVRDELRGNKELFYPYCTPQLSSSIHQQEPVFPQVLKKDILLSYPYESMQTFLELLQEAGEDPDVISIKMTLYRVARNSQVVEALIQAADNGKKVTVLVELRARFDEMNNLEWSRRLEKAGCHVIYGIDFYKVHAKLCLITYHEGNIIKHLTIIGTGNFNEITARQYTDMVLMTAHEGIACETADIFSKLEQRELVRDNKRHLLVSPNCMENQIFRFMEEEIAEARMGNPAYIGIKVNSLSDKVMIDKLIECSRSGVQVDLIVRGICCLVPGIQGVSDHIRVISVVGRFLEHSRIYIFGTPDRNRIYLSSADFMTRNMIRRVEVAVPIYNQEIRERILSTFQTILKDNNKARELTENGEYIKKETLEKNLDSQELFIQEAYLASGREYPCDIQVNENTF